MNRKRNRIIRLAALSLLIGGQVFVACICSLPQEPVFDDPTDQEGTNYTPPGVVITGGPADGTTVNDSTVTFSWAGDETYITRFSYRLDSLDWSSFSPLTSVLLTDLSEGEHVFRVLASYGTGQDGEVPAVVRFVINNIQGPALLFNPSRVTVSRNDSFTVDIIADDVAAMMSVNAELVYNRSRLAVDRVEKGPFLDKSGGYVWLDTLSQGTDSLMIASTTLKTDPEQPGGVNGTGVVARVTFIALNIGAETITFSDNCSFKSLDYQETIILNTRNSLDVTINQ